MSVRVPLCVSVCVVRRVPLCVSVSRISLTFQRASWTSVRFCGFRIGTPFVYTTPCPTTTPTTPERDGSCLCVCVCCAESDPVSARYAYAQRAGNVLPPPPPPYTAVAKNETSKSKSSLNAPSWFLHLVSATTCVLFYVIF
jgi:hypothetical protein